MNESLIPKIQYDFREKTISQIGFNSGLTKKSESIFSQGNGYLGLRAVDDEEAFFNKEDFFVNGLFNIGDPNEVSELANLADCLQTKIIIDNVHLSLLHSLISYRKTIHLTNGLLERKIVWSINAKIFELTYHRIVSQHDPNFYGQKIYLKQLQGEPSSVLIFPKINGQTTNRGVQHFKEGTKILLEPSCLQYREETTESNRYVVHTMIVRTQENGKMLYSGLNDNYVIKMDRRQVGFRIKCKLAVDQPIVLEKMMAVNTSVDSNYGVIKTEHVIDRSLQDFNRLKNISFDQMVLNNKNAYDEIYNQFYLKIDGDNPDADYDRLMFLFSIYHTNNFVPKNNPFLSVGAKGLSGEGYQGHCYWDTEFFVIPNFTFTNPKISRNLLVYRYKGIEGARKKAQEAGCQGAQYPWEMAWPFDGEVTPYWGQPDIVTGKQIPIASRQQEIHVSADIAICVHQYFQATLDEEFMKEMGYEMIIDTAWFYACRAEWKQWNYEITNVMGPNEYKGNINNNHYMNLAVKRNLELALYYIFELSKNWKGQQILARIYDKLPYKISIEKMVHVKDHIKQQFPNHDKIVPENDSFLSLPRNDIKPFQLLGDAGKTLFNTEAGIRCLGSQIVKQADVVLSTFIFSELFTRDVIEANFNYYEAVTTHDSSLSPSTHAIVANDLRKSELAYKFFKYGVSVDFNDNFKSSDMGIHAGAITAIWQMVVYGFGGFRFVGDKIHFNPLLPKTWNCLEYKIIVKHCQIWVRICQDKFSLQLTLGEKLIVYVNNRPYEISPNPQEFNIVTSYN